MLVLMLILGGGALAHGALLVARGALFAAQSRADRLEHKVLERLALDRALASGVRPEARETPEWDMWDVPDPRPEPAPGVVVRLHRLGPETWWASAMDSEEAVRRVGSAGRLLWWMEPVTRVAALEGVVTVGVDATVAVESVIETVGYGAAEAPLTPTICEAEIGDAFAGVWPSALAALDSGLVRPGLGLVPFDTLLARTPVVVDGVGTPEPSEIASRCVVEDIWNWGDPERPSRPCGGHLVVRAAASPLRVSGGTGQGAWVVDGDVVLAEGARLHGLVLASGALVLEDSAELHGVAVAAGGIRAEAGTRIRGSACWAVRGLRAAAAVWAPGPVPVPGVSAITP